MGKKLVYDPVQKKHVPLAGSERKWIDAKELISNTTDGATDNQLESPGNDINRFYKTFPHDAVKHVQAVVRDLKNHLNPAAKNIAIEYVCKRTGGTAGNASFAARAVFIDIEEDDDPSFGSIVSETVEIVSVDKQYKSLSGTITPAGTPSEDAELIIDIYNDIHDAEWTADANIYLKGIWVYFNQV